MPFGVDALVIYFAARDERLFWMYPLLAAAGSLAGATVMFWIGQKAGEGALARYLPAARLDRLRQRVQNRGAVVLALPALLPPPFPLSALVLTCGALGVNRGWFLSTFGAVRLLRFSAGAVVARMYGPGILRTLPSETVHVITIGFIAAAVVGTIVSGALCWRKISPRQLRAA
jgi:membrane protein YqaA with SNARE-associated domain